MAQGMGPMPAGCDAKRFREIPGSKDHHLFAAGDNIIKNVTNGFVFSKFYR